MSYLGMGVFTKEIRQHQAQLELFDLCPVTLMSHLGVSFKGGAVHFVPTDFVVESFEIPLLFHFFLAPHRKTIFGRRCSVVMSPCLVFFQVHMYKELTDRHTPCFLHCSPPFHYHPICGAKPPLVIFGCFLSIHGFFCQDSAAQ